MADRRTNVLTVLVSATLIMQTMQLVGARAVEEGEAAAAVVRARSIELVNKDGQVVAQLFAGDDGGGNLRLRSGDGVVRVKLGATDDGSGLVLMDTEAEPAVQIRSKSGESSLTLTEKGKDARVIEP
jgi:hypothetical protein